MNKKELSERDICTKNITPAMYPLPLWKPKPGGGFDEELFEGGGKTIR